MESKYNALIEIRVPKTDGTEGIGTGYPVAKNRILTARHVLHPDGRDTQKPIEVRWYYKCGKANDFRPINKIAWEDNNKEVDVAVLDCEFPDEAQFTPLSYIRPLAHAEWASKGFARAAPSREWEREPIGLRGNTHEMADTTWSFEIDVTTPPEIDKGWSGSSGFPVFVGNQILGVGTDAFANFAQKKLNAVAIWRLLDEFEDFCQAVKVPSRAEREQQRDIYRTKIAKELRQTPGIRGLLEQTGVACTGSGEPAESMALALLTLPDIRACDALHRAFAESLKKKRYDLALGISRIVNLVLPAVLDEDDAAKVLGRDEGTIVGLRCYTRTLAEIIMAKCDRREAKFRSPPPHITSQLKETWPVGIHEICWEPESGIRRASDNELENFNMMMEKKYLDDDEIDAWGTEDKESELKKRVERLSEEATQYFIIRSLAVYPDNMELDSKVRSISNLYRQIAFLLLSKPLECGNRDADLLYRRANMLVYRGDTQ